MGGSGVRGGVVLKELGRGVGVGFWILAQNQYHALPRDLNGGRGWTPIYDENSFRRSCESREERLGVKK